MLGFRACISFIFKIYAILTIFDKVEKCTINSPHVFSTAMSQNNLAIFRIERDQGVCLYSFDMYNRTVFHPVAAALAPTAVSHPFCVRVLLVRAMSADRKTSLRRVCHRWRSSKATGFPVVGPPIHVVVGDDVVLLVCGRSKWKVLSSNAVQPSVHSTV